MAWTSPHTFVPNELDNAAILNTSVRDNFNALFPVGRLVYLNVAPTAVATTLFGKFIELNGVAVSRSTYANLFSGVAGICTALGTTYGAGDGSTTFNLPDLHGRQLISAGRTGAHADVDAFGDSDGQTLANRRAKHGHSVSGDSHTHSASSVVTGTDSAVHSHGYTVVTVNPSVGPDFAGTSAKSSTQPSTGSNAESGTHAHAFSFTTSGGSRSIGNGGSGNTANAPGYLVGGCWFMAYT